MRDSILQALRPYQREPTQQLLAGLRRHGFGFDLSPTGTGKTYVGAAIAAELQVPALAVVPKIAESSWREASAHFQDKISCVSWELLRTGGTQFGAWENGAPPPKDQRIFYKCSNCQCKFQPDFIPPCQAHFAGLHCFETKYKPFNYGKFIFHPAIRLLIFDEIHRAANDSLNSDMVIAAKRQGIPTLGLTATLAHSILQMRATGYLAGLHKLADFDYWLSRRGCRRVPMRGIQWMLPKEEQDAMLRDIGAQIISTSGIRIPIESIPDFPGRHIQADLFDLPDAETAELNHLLEELEAIEERRAFDVDPEHALTVRLRNRQRIEILKIPVAQELAESYREQNYSVVFFVDFSGTANALKKLFPKAGVIDGSVTGAKREAVIKSFQANETRELIVNNKAGGIALSLQDLDGGFRRVGIVFPTDSAVTMQQLFGRLARSGGKSDALYRVIFAARTLETKMRWQLGQRYSNLAAINGEEKSSCNV